MKIFVEQYDAVIDGWFNPIEEAKKGEIILHKKVVSKVYFYQKQIIDGQESFLKIELSKAMILDLANDIKNIEKQVITMPFDELPF